MSFVREKQARRYFLFVLGAGLLLMLAALGLGFLHAAEVQRALLERERTVTAALLDQGVPGPDIAAALQNTAPSAAGDALLARAGRTEETPLPLLALPAQSALRFGAAALGVAALFAVTVAAVTALWLRRREQLYQNVIDTVAEYAEGRFRRHLPQNENGTLYQMFGGIEELAMALQSKSESEQASKAFLRDMISDISHQLKTPLAALGLYAEILLNEPDRPETVTHFAGQALQSLQRMEQLIQSLLKMARLDAGSIHFDRQPHPVHELVERALAPFTARAAQEGKRLLTEGAPDQVLCCDLEWTGEALGNLVKNALDHTERGGTVRVQWQSAPALFRLSVCDDGSGIPPEDLPHIFQRFYRSRASGDPNGAGLGLPLAKSIAEGQGGLLTVDATGPEGTTFTLSFLTNLTKPQDTIHPEVS
ncbi:MAG: sensor histidine kinase [Blautia massiliensis (ex Durand et al. 2017)]